MNKAILYTERDKNNLRRLLDVGHKLEQALNAEKHLMGDVTKANELWSVFKHRLTKFSLQDVLPQDFSDTDPSLCSIFHRINEFKETFEQRRDARSIVALLAPLERLADISLKDSDWLHQVRAHDREHQIKNEDKQKKIQTGELVLVLDNIRSAYNVGSILRSADAMGVKEVYCCGYTPSATHRLVQKTALGAEQTVSVFPQEDHRTLSTEDIIIDLKARGFQVVGLETATNSKKLYEIHFSQATVLVAGNERFGLSPKTLSMCDFVCEIPMCGLKNSLNVGVALTVVGFEFLRQRQWA